MQNREEYLKNDEEEMEKTLKDLLHKLFRIDLEDLDFGIYKIMNFKREEINKFIENDLIEAVEKEFEKLYEKDRKTLENDLKEIRREIIEELGEDAIDENGSINPLFEGTKLGKKYKEKQVALNNLKAMIQDKTEIFSRIYEFFSRYYVDGDLIPIRRYTRENDYIIPYNGEEIYFHWANKDQYYVKTTEYFQKYVFMAGKYTVQFRLREAYIDKNNVKGKDKFFILPLEEFLKFENNMLTIYFEYRELTNDEFEELGLGERPNKTTIKDKLIEIALNKINDALSNHPDVKNQLNKLYKKNSGENTDKTVMEAHIRNYIAKNDRDYFIHKNLKKFFLTELDFYIKNEMLPLKDIEGMDETALESVMRRVRVFKNLCTKIIGFLAEIEEFEKILWEKKKFVLRTEYVITLDKIAEYAGAEFLESILDEILSNEKQIEEWKELFSVEVKSEKDLIAENTLDGKKWKKLPVDTKHFGEDFKWNLIVALSKENDLDEILDGVLIKSENWQALNLMVEKYRERVKTIYIDPPYNTGNDEFMFKDRYQDSSWLTMMNDRLSVTKKLLQKSGVIFISVDDVEQSHLKLLMDNIFGVENFVGSIVWWKRHGRNNNAKLCSDVKDFLIWFRKSNNLKIIREPRTELSNSNYSNPDDDPRGVWTSISYVNPATKKERPNLVYGIKNPFTGEEVWHPTNAWKYSWEEYQRHVKENRLWWGLKGENKYPRLKVFLSEVGGLVPKDIWTQDEAGTTDEATRVLSNLFGEGIVFKNPKPPKLIVKIGKFMLNNIIQQTSIFMDFFAGSGTTAHAVMLLNKEDGGHRKFILVEMADYFDTVIVPRIKKVAYSFNWKDGKPQDMDSIGVFFKYHTLEQYEDTLNNIIFAGKEGRQVKLREFEDYIYHVLEYGTRGSASRLNIDKLKKPFSYKMEILEDGIPKTVNVDLVETFNYLLGLHVKKLHRENRNGLNYVWVVGELRDKSAVIVVWRETEDLNLVEDKNYITEKIKELAGANPDYIYVNGDSYVPNAIPIETKFMKLMGA